jgi:hypothetical protein
MQEGVINYEIDPLSDITENWTIDHGVQAMTFLIKCVLSLPVLLFSDCLTGQEKMQSPPQ